jgi:hypothetical protein
MFGAIIQLQHDSFLRSCELSVAIAKMTWLVGIGAGSYEYSELWKLQPSPFW